MTSDTNIRWVFDRVPASGARRGGEAAQHVFKHSVDTFVREVVQNANDQALNAAEIRFGYQVLEGDSLSRFLRAMGWDTLVPHLQNAADTGRAEGLDEALEQIRSGPPMRRAIEEVLER